MGAVPVVALAILLAPAAAAACRDAAEVPRTILALYDGKRVPAPRFTRIHRYAELPLNHLGYRLIYRDISAEAPAMPESPLAATISWFHAPVEDSSGFAAWRAGLRDGCGGMPATILLGHTGLGEAAASSEAGRAYLGAIGVAQAEGEAAVGAFSKVASADTGLVGYESAFEVRPGPYARITAAGGAESRLALQSGDAAIDLVVLGPRAVYAHDSALVRDDPRGGPLWIIDPFALFGHALGGPTWPVPDTTTLSGRRMFFATVASEGWLMRLPALRFGDRPPLVSEVLESELVSPYPDLPLSIALLAGDLDPGIAGQAADRGREVGEHLLQLPHVQAATSGLSMIRNWGFFENYDPAAEEETLTSGASGRAGGGIVASAVQNLGEAFSGRTASALDITPFAPRKYAGLPFDLAAETGGALGRIAELAPDGRAPQLFLWSGNAMPFSGAIAATREAGVWNMGGGGGVAPDTMPSLANLWPLGLETTGGLQVYGALSGDDLYTEFWTGNLAGFQALAQSLERTETPRRLKPFHLSFAARSAFAFASRQSVRLHLERARAAEVAPVQAVRFAEAVAGFQQFRAIGDGDLAWRIEDRGGLQTVRFDEATGLALDLAASEGVIGARRHHASLYVALDPGSEAPRIALAESNGPAGVVAADPAPALVQARAEVLAFHREACASRVTLLGFGLADTEWLGAPGLPYEVTLYDADGVTRRHWEQLDAGPDGRIAVKLPLPPGIAADVAIATPCPQG
jgi:polysaccharide biosynthesis protein PelA